MCSRSAQKRRKGVLIWINLLRLGATSSYTLDELLRLLSQENDGRARGQIVTVIGRLAAKSGYDTQKVMESLEHLARSDDVDMREKALQALVRTVSECTSDISEYAMRLLDAALLPPTNAGRLTSLRPIIERLILTDVDLAAILVERMVCESQNAGLGINGKHKLLGRLKPTVRNLVRAAPKDVRRQLLNLVPNLGINILDSVGF
jgi:hypothetical protein